MNRHYKTIPIILILIMSGCAGFQKWEKTDKILYYGLVTASVVDIAISEYGVDNGAKEGNPAFNGSPWLMIPINAGVLWLTYSLTNKFPKERGTILKSCNVLRWGIVGWNFNICKDF